MNVFRSVRAKVTLAAMAVTAIVLTLASVALVRLVETDLIEAAEESLFEDVEFRSGGFDDDVEFVEFDDFFYDFELDGVYYTLGRFELDDRETGGERIAFGELRAEGTSLALLFVDVETEALVNVVDPLTGMAVTDPKLLDLVDTVIFEVRDLDDDSFVVGVSPLDEVRESTEFVVDALTTIVPVAVLVLGSMTWLLVGRALEPVDAISRRVEDITTNRLDQRVPVPSGGDEVTRLATVMNDMLTRLQQGGERQRQFSADASHELRSPLSSVRAAGEMISRRPDGPRTATLAADVVAEADRMNELIESLLDLSRLDEDAMALETAPVDLAALVSTVVDDVSAGDAVRERMVAVAFEGADGALVAGSVDHLRRLARNLVENAVRHADATVEVCVVRDGERVVLRVEDDGPGIAHGDRERVFERFTRLDGARTRSTGGFGLGLALVRAIAERHRGRVSVDRSDRLRGAEFIVDLPGVAASPTAV